MGVLPNAVGLTRDLIRFQTLNPPGDEEDCAIFLARLLAGSGFEVKLHRFGPRRFNLVASLAGASGGLPLGFTGHLDTVPLGTAPWACDPFGGEIADGRIYGRGASDMKAGIAAFVVGCLRSAKDIARGAGLQLILTGGEETGCDGARALVEQAPHHLKPLGALIVGEPTANRPLLGHKGALWLRGVTHGVAAHGSMPERGKNAIYGATEAIGLLRGFRVGDAHPLMGGPSLSVGTVHGGQNVNSVPDRVEFEVDIRTVPGIEHRCVMHRLQALLGNDVHLASMADLPSVYTDPADEWMARVIALCAQRNPAQPAPPAASYFTDATLLKPACGLPPTVILGPGEPSMAHKVDEYCSINCLEEAVEIYSKIALDWSRRS
jgi:succinyl-diaminopimelate desuccinylase